MSLDPISCVLGPYGGVGRPAAAPIKVATDTLPEITGMLEFIRVIAAQIFVLASHFEQRDGKVVWYPGPPLILVRPPRAIHSLAYQEWKKVFSNLYNYFKASYLVILLESEPKCHGRG